MTKQSQIIFVDGKEKALESLFSGDGSPFGFLAIGYAEQDNGFEEANAEQNKTNGFSEISSVNGYERIALTPSEEAPDKDVDTGKVLVKFKATLPNENISVNQNINQIAVVDRQDISNDTVFYCATTFPTFTKSIESSITFVIGFRL